MVKAIVCRDTYANGGWKLEDVEVREPGAGELLVDMVASGICHTDALMGGLPEGSSPVAFYPRILGHEGSGIVKKVGPGVTVAQPGDPVLLSYAFCQSCDLCTAKHYSHCPSFTELNFAGPHNVFKANSSDGSSHDISGTFFGQSSFASQSIVKQASVVNAKDLIKDKKELQLFSPLGCGIQTGSGSVLNAAKVTSDDVVLVTGLGGVGLSAIMGAKIAGAKQIIGLDKVNSRLELAKELGATHVINGDEIGDKSLVDVIREVAGGSGPTVTIETTGVPALAKDGLTATRNRGRYVQVGTTPFDFKLEIPTFDFMMSGKQYIGAIEGHAYPPEYVPKMIEWYREGKFPIDKLMKLFPASEFDQGLKEMKDGSTIKPILCWD